MSLPSLDARQYAASDNTLARALASMMRLPSLIDGVESEDQLDAIKSRLDTATALDQLFA